MIFIANNAKINTKIFQFKSRTMFINLHFNWITPTMYLRYKATRKISQMLQCWQKIHWLENMFKNITFFMHTLCYSFCCLWFKDYKQRIFIITMSNKSFHNMLHIFPCIMTMIKKIQHVMTVPLQKCCDNLNLKFQFQFEQQQKFPKYDD